MTNTCPLFDLVRHARDDARADLLSTTVLLDRAGAAGDDARMRRLLVLAEQHRAVLHVLDDLVATGRTAPAVAVGHDRPETSGATAGTSARQSLAPAS